MASDSHGAISNFAKKPVGSTKGRPDSSGSSTDAGPMSTVVPLEITSRQGTVVIRATVEHIGLAGDTEMTVTVKWPASAYCPQPSAPSTIQSVPAVTAATVPENGPAAKNFDPGLLYGEIDADLGPYTGNTVSPKKTSATKKATATKKAPARKQV